MIAFYRCLAIKYLILPLQLYFLQNGLLQPFTLYLLIDNAYGLSSSNVLNQKKLICLASIKWCNRASIVSVIWCKMKACVVISLVLLVQLRLDNRAVSARVMDRCSLALEMDALGVPRSDLARWVFLALDSSEFRTDLVSEANKQDVRRYGIFQLDDSIWCKSKKNIKSQNICKINCEELLSDEIKESVRCAQIAKHEQGWLPWPGHRHYLFAHPRSIDDCFTEPHVNRTAADTASPPVSLLDSSNTSNNIGLADECNKREFI